MRANLISNNQIGPHTRFCWPNRRNRSGASLRFEDRKGRVDVGAADGALVEGVGAGSAGHQVLARKKKHLGSIS
jgi:hypothetical protein